MKNSLPAALAFDLDGVIFQSMWAKHHAMLSVFPPEARDRLSAIVLSLTGVPRMEKLRHVFATFKGGEPTDSELKSILESYDQALLSANFEPPLTPGIAEYLQQETRHKYVCSSAPQEEILHHLARVNLLHSFMAVFGAPTTKIEALRDISILHADLPVVFFGDGVADWRAAQSSNAYFVAVTAESDQFHDASVPKLSSFADSREVNSAVVSAVAAHAA